MNETYVVELSVQWMWTAALLAAPVLLTALLVGLAVSLFQGLTSLQDQTLSFVPKIIAVGVARLSGSFPDCSVKAPRV
jgi:flagellar biosynthetic protein FliQ